MRLTVIGDPHAKKDNLDKIVKLTSIVEELGNTSIWLGDMLDTKELVRGSCLNTWFNYFRDSKLQHYILVGNHDWFNLECKEHSLEVLQALDNVHIVSAPVSIAPGIGFLPYIHDLDVFKKEYKKLAKGCKIIFMHQGVTGFDYGNGYIAENEVPLEALGSTQVISGHFHKYQESKNLTYLGSPFSHSFGESNQEKYIGVWDSVGPKLELIKTPFPRHETIDFDCDKQNVIMTTPDMSHTRIILKGKPENIKKFNKEPFKKAGAKIIEQPEEVLGKTMIAESESNEVKFVKWASEIKKLDKDTIKLGLKILAEAR